MPISGLQLRVQLSHFVRKLFKTLATLEYAVIVLLRGRTLPKMAAHPVAVWREPALTRSKLMATGKRTFERIARAQAVEQRMSIVALHNERR